MQLPEIEIIEKAFPKFHKEKVKTFFMLVQSIILTKSSCLNTCKTSFYKLKGNAEVKLESVYKQMLRFFEMKSTEADLFCSALFLFLQPYLKSEQPIRLVMDRTNWKLGKEHINVLFLGFMLNDKIFIPLIWEPLPKDSKRGNSSTKLRKKLMDRFLEHFQPAEGQEYILLADREFVGEAWWHDLSEKNIQFVIRLRYQDCWKYLILCQCVASFQILDGELKKLQTGQIKSYHIDFKGFKYRFDAQLVLNPRSNNQEMVYLLSNLKDEAQDVFQLYRCRWTIEVFFKHTKTNGFNLEDTHLSQNVKIQLLIAAVACAYLLCIRACLFYKPQTKPQKPTLFKKNKTYYQKVSDFKFGLEQFTIKHCDSFADFIFALFLNKCSFNLVSVQ